MTWSFFATIVEHDVLPGLALLAAIIFPLVVLSLIAKPVRRHLRHQRRKYKQEMARHR